MTTPDPSLTHTLTTADPLALPAGPGERDDLKAIVDILQKTVTADNAIIAKRDATIATLRAELAKRDATIDVSRKTAEGNQAFVSRVMRERDEANATIAELKDKNDRQGRMIAGQANTIGELLARLSAIEAGTSSEPGIIEWAKDVIFRHDRPQNYDRLDMTEAVHGLRFAIARYEALAQPSPSAPAPTGERGTGERERRLVDAADELLGQIEGGFLLYRDGRDSEELAEFRAALSAYATPAPEDRS